MIRLHVPGDLVVPSAPTKDGSSWLAAALRSGATCLFTDVRNPTSNHVYREIGFRPLADFAEFWLQPGP